LEDDAPDIKEDKEITEVKKTTTVESDELPTDFWSMDFDGAMRKEGGHVGKLRYSNHNVSNETKYPELVPQVFKQKIVVNQLGEMITQPHQWAVGLDSTRILGLLKIPHFGRGQYTTTCIKKLLAVRHGGDIWLDKPVPVTFELIT
jgi:hypothetical protein